MKEVEVLTDCGIGKKGKIIGISDTATEEAIKLGLVRICGDRGAATKALPSLALPCRV
jgi:hypothetical protein